MKLIDEHLSEQFYRWELRGRGWELFNAPVALEPPFRAFTGYSFPRQKIRDEGRRHTITSGVVDHFKRWAVPQPAEEEVEEFEPEPEPELREPQELIELQLSLPQERPPSTSQMANFVRQVARSGDPIVFEIVGTAAEILPQFTVSLRAARRVAGALQACVPKAIIAPEQFGLLTSWTQTEHASEIVELGLAREFFIPLVSNSQCIPENIVAALAYLSEGEVAVFQVLFEPLVSPWADSIRNAVVGSDGDPIFVNRPELFEGARDKIAAPLFGVVGRLAARSPNAERCLDILVDMAAALSSLSSPAGNMLIPLTNEGYEAWEREIDLIDRVSCRSGMILNLDELTPLLTLPTAAAASRLRRDVERTRPAPQITRSDSSVLLGDNVHSRTTTEVYLAPEQRVRHMHVIGASGKGKSTLLFNLIQQDITNGQGVAVLDPHGDLVDHVLESIPPERVDDVVVIDPSDEQFSVGLNILAAHSDLEKTLLASDLVGVFRRLSTTWGDQMDSVLRNAILAFLESSEGGTLADLRHFLLDTDFREKFLNTVSDPEIVYYWRRAFSQLTGNKSVGPVVTRLDEFLSRKPIRYMVAQQTNRVDFSALLNQRRILLAKLPQGLIGRENSYLLGSLLVSKIQQAAMARQQMRETARQDFWVYIDEFHCFITPSMTEILTGARKYRVGLILAHQNLRQLQSDPEVADSVLSNSCIRVVFGVSDADAHALEKGFRHFEANDLMNLSRGQAICRIERSDVDFNLSVRKPVLSLPEATSRRQAAIDATRHKYAIPRADVEQTFTKQLASRQDAPKPAAPTAEHPAQPVALELRELGRGGLEHKEIQRQIKGIAEKIGFHAVIEKAVLSGAGHVDVSLESERQNIACEISITTKPEEEVENVLKCLAAGYADVVVVSPQKDRLIALARAFREALGDDDSRRVHVCLPAGAASLLKKLWRQARRSEPVASRTSGYKIKRTYSKESLEEGQAQAAESALFRSIRRALSGE